MMQVFFMVIIVILYGFSLYITRKERRSFRSWFFERLLIIRIEKRIFVASEHPEEFLAEHALDDAKPYEFPIALKLIGKIERINISGMDCMVLSSPNPSMKKILYLHGGSYVEQPRLAHWLFLDQLVKDSHATVYVPIYPKAPVHQFQESYDKILELYSLLLTESKPQDVVFMGDSAGGGLALGFSQYLISLRMPQPARCILLSPWLDITMENPGIAALERKDPMLLKNHLIVMGKAWAGGLDPHDFRVSPITGPLKGLAPITLYVGTHELFLADARKLRIRALAQGVSFDYHEFPKMNHVFPVFPIPEARRVQHQISYLVGGRPDSWTEKTMRKIRSGIERRLNRLSVQE